MSMLNWRGREPVLPVLILIVVVLACLIPFLGKAFNMDDPLFVWCARHIQSSPCDFYGFNLNWEGKEAPMAAVTKNPPLAAFYLALVGSLLGWSESALHAGSLLPALAAVIGTFYLARGFCSHPLWAALTVATAPAFVLSSTGIQCDTMMLAFWVWSVFFWMEGLRSRNSAKLCLASILIAACCLTKYFGLSLIPLLLAYSLPEWRRIGWRLLYLLLPVLAFGTYEWLACRLYGRGLLLDAATYSTHYRVGGELLARLLAGLAFVGGCMIVLLAAAPLLWGTKRLLAGVAAVGVTAVLVVAMKKVGMLSTLHFGNAKWLFLAQLSLAVVAGASVFFLAAADWQSRKTPESALLFLWIAGTFVFCCFVNWTVSGRNILPMLPAVALALVRRLETIESLGETGGVRPQRLLAPLGGSLAIALVVAQADYKWADSARNMASILKQELGAVSSGIRFEGHWGFQYYMERLGAKALDRLDLRLVPDQVIVVPRDNSYLFSLPQDCVVPWRVYETQASTWLSTMNGRTGAGYYSDAWGRLPFVFGPVPAEEYLVFRVK
jgi:hypothetical protein